MTVRLGVNVDHVATVRNARGGAHPDPWDAAMAAMAAGADGITMHLREDRRHIRDADIERIAATPGVRFYFFKPDLTFQRKKKQGRLTEG